MNKLKKIIKNFCDILFEARAKYFLKRQRKSIENNRIVFLCQCQHIWDKALPLVDGLQDNPKFNVILYVIKDEEKNDDETIFFSYKGNVNIIRYEEISLKKLKPRYVIYTRPYDSALPKDIRIKKVVKYAKTCYLPYGYSLMKIGDVNLNKWFIRYLYLLFADNIYAYNYFVSKREKNIKTGIQKVVNLGYPYMENLVKNFKTLAQQESNGFNNIENADKFFKVLWTPRWTTDVTIGGSNFFKYKDQIINYLQENKDIAFVFRPHPYLFTRSIKDGIITEEEATKYLNNIDESERMYYDVEDTYLGTFENTNVLITDISSIVSEYLLTKKPIIFCHNDVEDLNEIFEDMKNYMYNAYTMEDIIFYINELKKGVDPLKDKRENYAEQFGNKFLGSTQRIIQFLEKDMG